MAKGKKKFKIENPRGTISTYTVKKGALKEGCFQDLCGRRGSSRIWKMDLKMHRHLWIPSVSDG